MLAYSLLLVAGAAWEHKGTKGTRHKGDRFIFLCLLENKSVPFS